MTRTRILPCGPTALLIEVETLAEAAALAMNLREIGRAEITEIVLAARTVLIECRTRNEVAGLADVVAGLSVARLDDIPRGVVVEVPTIYDGADLQTVAESTGLDIATVIDIHSSTLYTAAFCGFTPGFAYLTGLDSRLHLPRRAAPRAHVPAGSVAIGADFTGVYPTRSPGGWHLLGYTNVPMWDPARQRPAYIVPGDRVRFVPAQP